MRNFYVQDDTLVITDPTAEDRAEVVRLLHEVDPSVAVRFVHSDDERPLLSRQDVARIQRAANRCTVALVILIVVIALIQLGRFVGVGG